MGFFLHLILQPSKYYHSSNQFIFNASTTASFDRTSPFYFHVETVKVTSDNV